MAESTKYFLIGGGVLLLLLVLGYFSIYNSLIGSEQNVKGKWAAVETQYQRRVDLIPSIVSTVQGVSGFEKSTLTEITKLRSQWQTQTSQDARIQTANQLEGTISKLLLITENYPDLKSTAAYQDLIVQLEGTENRVAFARNEFNDAVRDYNKRIKTIPGNMIAPSMGLTEKAFFQATTTGAENAPTVTFPATG